MQSTIDRLVIDSSALISIFEQEHDASFYAEAIESVSSLSISAFTVFETSIVLNSRRGLDSVFVFRDFLEDYSVVIYPFDLIQINWALTGYAQFGKGVYSKAKLNMGDCASYALSKHLNIPLLFKGDDFTHTDVLMFS